MIKKFFRSRLLFPRATTGGPFKRTLSTVLGVILVGIFGLAAYSAAGAARAWAGQQAFLPVVARGSTALGQPTPTSTPLPPSPPPALQPIIRAPHFAGEILYPQTAVFWFGRVTPSENYADVRVGYNDQELYINLGIADRRLWYDTTPAPGALSEWDSASIFLQPGSGEAAYRFDAQLSFAEARPPYQAAFRLENGAWAPANISFNATTAWRGVAPNVAEDDRGWVLRLRLPFASLDLSAPPAAGTVWRMGILLHDRDDPAAAPLPDQPWPAGFTPLSPLTWGRLGFGLPVYQPPAYGQTQMFTIRHKLDGAVVVDGEVGGGSVCGDGLDFWSEWGWHVAPGAESNSDFNIQNQSDIADWPCFARYYVTFPLDSLPPGLQVVSAELTMHQMGSSGDPGQAEPSLIQVFTVRQPWQESTLSWNNAPPAFENVSRAWVDPVSIFPGWPGIPWKWDLSLAVSQSYSAGETALGLALYSADSAYHSGKYFVSSDTGDWNAAARPTLRVVLAEPTTK